MRLDKARARALLHQEADQATQENVSAPWVRRVEELSALCQGASRTHIAFLGTAMLAKAVNLNADVFAVKAGAGTPGAYSARGLGHDVLVPYAVELGINLGVTGREPLNNQPYFQIKRVSRDIPVHGRARAAVGKLCDILDELAKIGTEKEARAALRAFIYVRRRYKPKYLELLSSAASISTDALVGLVEAFVAENSEGGKRAQAVVAGLLDVFAGPDRVETGRINDPDRHVPGDAGVRSTADPDKWERMFEVRDKAVTVADVLFFASKCLEAGVEEAAVVAVAAGQPAIDFERAHAWAAERGLALTIFSSWRSLVEQVLFWAEQPQVKGASLALTTIYDRLLELEVSEEGAAAWLGAASGAA